MDKFWQSLSFLLPQGFAWPRDPQSTVMRVLRGWALSLSQLHDFTHATVRQWQPATTTLRLAEWEAACGLPDSCFGTEQTEALRRQLLQARLHGLVLPYDDSSPAAPGVLAELCKAVGYTVEVRYNTPFRVGRNRVGQRLGLLNGKLYVLVTLQSTLFRVGANRVGQRLRIDPISASALQCYLERIAPARYQVEMVFI